MLEVFEWDLILVERINGVKLGRYFCIYEEWDRWKIYLNKFVVFNFKDIKVFVLSVL